jgi:hypothetical protein
MGKNSLLCYIINLQQQRVNCTSLHFETPHDLEFSKKGIYTLTHYIAFHCIQKASRYTPAASPCIPMFVRLRVRLHNQFAFCLCFFVCVYDFHIAHAHFPTRSIYVVCALHMYYVGVQHFFRLCRPRDPIYFRR